MALLASPHMGRYVRHSGVDDVYVWSPSATEHASGAVPDSPDEDVSFLLTVPDCWRRCTHVSLHVHEPLLEVADLELAHLGRHHWLQRLRP